MGSDDAALSSTTGQPSCSRSLQPERHRALEIRTTADRGRGVFAIEGIPANTVVDESPVLIVSNDEYTRHSLSKSIFESYLFTWDRANGHYALALGLGSLFNHDTVSPNVSYALDKTKQVIRYTTKRHVDEGEELCIFYGHGVHFGDKGELLVEKDPEAQQTEEEAITALESVNIHGGSTSVANASDNMHDPVIHPDDLPFQIVTGILKPEDMPLETVDAYFLNVSPRESGRVLTFLKDQNLAQIPQLRHCRRIRSHKDSSTVQILLCHCETYSLTEMTGLLQAHVPGLGEPQVAAVPANPARTASQLRDWSNAYWPVSLIPIKEDVMAASRNVSWTKDRLRWVRSCAERLVKLSEQARAAQQVPVGCFVTESWVAGLHSSQNLPIELCHDLDTRKSSGHPLAHCAHNMISQVARMDKSGTRPSMPTTDANYLLTGLTVFITHEPCLFCSMALLHSRIACLIYLKSSPGSGGCGTEYSLHEQKGTNHHFEVWTLKEGMWRDLTRRLDALQVDA